jgi:hypothetical protein
VFHCRGFVDAQAVALAVREQRTVVLQLDHLEPVEAQRVVVRLRRYPCPGGSVREAGGNDVSVCTR